MLARSATLALIPLLAGCSATLPDECDTAWTTYGRLRQCDPDASTPLWVAGLPVIIAELAEFLPGLEDMAADMTVTVEHVGADFPVGGYYYGYTDPGQIGIFLHEGFDHEPRRSALAHEYAHAWEHLVRGLSNDEYQNLDTHFREQELIVGALSVIHDPESETLKCFPL